MITVARINDDDTVTIDLNHPMAGKSLVFDVKIVEVREPLQEELSRLTGGCGQRCSTSGVSSSPSSSRRRRTCFKAS